jgi:hypothetical protein
LNVERKLPDFPLQDWRKSSVILNKPSALGPLAAIGWARAFFRELFPELFVPMEEDMQPFRAFLLITRRKGSLLKPAGSLAHEG